MGNSQFFSSASASTSTQSPEPQTYYDILQLPSSASVQDIRRAYRELSKQYHPDITPLPAAIAKVKFQALNEAYAVLSSPDKRFAYDISIGCSRFNVMRSRSDLRDETRSNRQYSSSAYLEPVDRPLSAGELFALFSLGLTFIGCILLVVVVGVIRGEIVF